MASRSFGIYVLHNPLLVLLAWAMDKLLHFPVWSMYLLLPVLLALLCAAAFACMPLLWRGVYDGHDLFPDQMRSAEFCTKPCVGCEYARGTGNNWWHVCEKQLAD